MKNYTFNWEIQTLVEQFVGAFNDVIIKRFDPTELVHNDYPGLSGEKVLFVYSPKQRVFYNLKTPAAGGLTVPIISVSISSISRDQTRVFNKNEGFVVDYNTTDINQTLIKNIPQPIPINIGIDMTIITKYQGDMDQILTNFIPYCDPYIIISWKLPGLNSSSTKYEIRSEVLWNGNIALQYPDNLQGTQAYRITASTNFTIKGWLFKKMDEVVKKIYTIESKFFTTDGTTADDNSGLYTSSPLQSISDFEKTLSNLNINV
jgi:hypothetical protein